MSTWSGQISSHSAGEPQSDPRQSAGILSLFAGRDAQALPRVISLGLPETNWNPDFYPPGDYGVSFRAGQYGGAIDKLTASSDQERNAVTIIRYGAGGSGHTVLADWRPGTYQLPPCDSVSVSVLPWGPYWTGRPFLFAASCSPGNVDGLHPLTFSHRGQMVSEFGSFWAPPRARAFELVDATTRYDPAQRPRLELSEGVSGVRSWQPDELDRPGERILSCEADRVRVHNLDHPMHVELIGRFYIAP